MGCDEAWAAGFIDGEGYLKLQPVSKRKSDGYINRKPGIEVCQTDLLPLKKLKRLYGGSIMEMTPSATNRKKVWRWDLSGSYNIRFALESMLPHLTVKKRQAKLLLTFLNVMGARGQKVAGERAARREAIYMMLKDARKGVPCGL